MTTAFHIVGALMSGSVTPPGFADPIFGNQNSNDCFVQDIDPRSRKIRAFLPIETTVGMIPLTGALAKVGSNPVYAFIRSQSDFIVGDARTILTLTSENEKQRLLPISIQMQLADISEDHSGKIGMRHRIRQNIQSVVSEKSARRFDLSFARSALWDIVLSLDDKILVEMSPKDVMSSFDVGFSGGTIALSVDPLISDQLTDQVLVRINAVFRQRFERARQGDLFSAFDEPAVPEGHDPRLDEALDDIYTLPRQETRLAQILKLIINRPEIGIPLLDIYKDRGQFANRVVSYARSYLTYGMERRERIGMIEHMIAPIYDMAFPMNRGLLLYELATSLGEFPSIAEAIKERTNQANARAVLDYKSEINRILIKTASEPT